MTDATTIIAADKAQPLVAGHRGATVVNLVRIYIELSNTGDIRIGDDSNVTTSVDAPLGPLVRKGLTAVVRGPVALGEIFIAGSVEGDTVTWTSS